MTLNKIPNCSYYSYIDGLLSFLYYPENNIVKCANANSTYRAIEFFARREFEIDWLTSNIGRCTLHLIIPNHLTEEEGLAILGETKESLYAQEIADKGDARDKLILNNIDNTTGAVIKEKYLVTTLKRLNSQDYSSRDKIVEWFNKYNIEVARPEAPIIIVSTKSKKTVIAEGKKFIMELFEKGLLRKLTKEEYVGKMNLNMRQIHDS